MLPPCCIEMLIVMSAFCVIWNGEEMRDTPGFQPHTLELLTRPDSLPDTGVFFSYHHSLFLLTGPQHRVMIK